MIRAILFDFNGIIIDDEPIQMKAYQEVLKAEGVEFTEEDYYQCTGMDNREFVQTQYKNAGKELADEKMVELIGKKNESWKRTVDEQLPLFEGVENFVKKCSRRFALGIVSMADRREIDHVLERAALGDSFSAIVSAEDVSKNKPDPECYLKGFQRLDQNRMKEGHYPLIHKECLVIEDSPQGIRAAKAAGMKVLAVTNTFDEKTLREAGADSVTRDLNDWMPESVAQVF